MPYELNVSQHGKHLFATHERSITDRDQLARLTKLFHQKFPAREGYKLQASYHQASGRELPIHELLQRAEELEAIDA